jgi:predicted Ser/Thr protein kinase
MTREPPAISIIIRDAQAAAAQQRPVPALAIIPEADLVVDASHAGLLGEGGFGVVRRGSWQGTPVAVKSLQRDAAEVGEAPARAFDREMQVLARLKHPNVVPVSSLLFL